MKATAATATSNVGGYAITQGTLAASALWAFLLGVLSEEQLLSWGWRLPFLLSFVLLIFAPLIAKLMQAAVSRRLNRAGPRWRRSRAPWRHCSCPPATSIGWRGHT